MLEEHEEGDGLDKERYLIKVGDDFIGIVDFIMENPRDKKPWLGLLIIRKDWTRKSFAGKALAKYEELMRGRNITEVRLGCFSDNSTGMQFWEKNSFQKVEEINFKEKPLWILEKKIVEDGI
ncbi:GNAT family N-acetyltransferase [Heyndrickxia sp. MSNUG]|uniref:GNAT family N-acetyltransferase n=1 Tax=Heyndrickxia sp. MSNUG TaxID=3136677 RepID=UPI003C2AE5B7